MGTGKWGNKVRVAKLAQLILLLTTNNALLLECQRILPYVLMKKYRWLSSRGMSEC